MTDNYYNIESKLDILSAAIRINTLGNKSDSVTTRDANIIVAKVVLAYLNGEVFEEAQAAEDPEPQTTDSKRLGVSPHKIELASKFLRKGFKSYIQIARHLSITTATVRTKIMPTLGRTHNVERKRFGTKGNYKYRIASLTAYK